MKEKKEFSDYGPYLNKIRGRIPSFRARIENLEVNLIEVETTVASINRRLSRIEDLCGPNHEIEALRTELEELIELRKSKGNLEHPVHSYPNTEALAKRARKHPYREDPPGYSITKIP